MSGVGKILLIIKVPYGRQASPFATSTLTP